ncbi:hypothetical protein CF319_g5685 [Tilletia indica]|nr:hypothetical protein CF319_g5685 [Tilletia indica]
MQDRYPQRFLTAYHHSKHRSDDSTLQALIGIEASDSNESQTATVDPCSAQSAAVDGALQTEDDGNHSEWPQPVSSSIISRRMDEFRKQTTIAVGPTCAICSRRSFVKPICFSKHGPETMETVSLPDIAEALQLLAITDEHVRSRDHPRLSFEHPLLEGLALDRDGINFDGAEPTLNICRDCLASLSSAKPKVPKMALANNNIRGWLPPDLADCTWLEERLCAKYLASTCIVRLYDLSAPGHPEHRPRVMKGHACAFPLNTMSTAVKLPWTFRDGGPLVSCIVIGPRPPRQQDLRKLFKVRRSKVAALLKFLKANFLDYPQFPDDTDALNELPEDDVPELLMRYVVHQDHSNVPSLFEAETSGIEPHPGLSLTDDLEASEGRTFIEHHGLIDLNGVRIPSNVRLANGLLQASGGAHPDMIIKHGSQFVSSYNNPGLFPGMYPTLFPWGVGGFGEDRQVSLSFDKQAKHLLDIADPSFRRHWSFIFVVANMKQRDMIHLGSRIACKARDFDAITRELQSLDLDTVRNVAEHLAKGGSFRTLSPDEAKIDTLLKKCELVSVRVPGSKAAMNLARAEIRSYIAQHGIFHLFLTLNPSPLHSPTFHIFYGDKAINLDLPTPPLPAAHERGVRVADDPVAASDYFHFHMSAVMQYLLGWDFEKGKSTTEGGLFGRIAAFYMVKEHTMRGQLHGHCLIWLQGGLNPQPLRQKLARDQHFRERYLAFLDSIVQHHIPETPTTSPDTDSNGSRRDQPARKPRQERPPDPACPDFSTRFTEDHALLGTEVQKHRCQTTCFKGGRTSCRFLFPRDLCEKTTFEEHSNSVLLMIKDPMMNWHNPALLVATRHNHDLQSVQSGKSSMAAASYITSYISKSDETPTNQVSMIKTVFDKMATYGEDATTIKTLLTKCVMQFGRERQIHAQQAATYVRELGDTWQSHSTVPMLSGALVQTTIRLYGPLRQSNSEEGSEEQEAHDTSGSSQHLDAGRADEQHRIGTDQAERTGGQLNADTANTGQIEDDDEDRQNVRNEEDGEHFLSLTTNDLAHQVDDYLHRGDSLSHLNFYDFVRFCSLAPAPKRPNKNHHALRESHPNYDSKVHRYTPEKPLGIPRPILSTFPRSNGTPEHGDSYCATMLAHFIPFGVDSPLKAKDISYEEAFRLAAFSTTARRAMENWAAITECEDARDQEQLLRRKREANRDALYDQAVHQLHGGTGDAADSATADIDLAEVSRAANQHSANTLTAMATLSSCGWFLQSNRYDVGTPPLNADSPHFTAAAKRTWVKEVAAIEQAAKETLSAPRATTGVLAESLGFDDEPLPETLQDQDWNRIIRLAPETEVVSRQERPPDELIELLVKERSLTSSQRLAFVIAARHFFEELHGVASEAPLRLFMHGEAGTGKTVVVRLLRELLERYGKGSEIMFVAPTGKAACAIGGSTQHSAFGIEIQKRALASEDLGHEQRDGMTARRIRHLQTTFANVRWVFFDEVSMTSCEMMAEIDQALRIGRQNPNTAFGGINVLFAGDLCQLPPVGGAALYSQGALSSKSAETQTKVELGRGAWLQINAVVNFVEQMRMRDADMASALSRLRLRRSTDEDADLFNQNALRSAKHPAGKTLGATSEAIVLMRTNETVRALNHRRAAQYARLAGKDFIISSAADKTGSQMTVERRQCLLNYNGTGKSKVGFGRVPLFIGMPVVYKGANISVALGITNGAFATVQGWHLEKDQWGCTIPKGVILKFASDVTWCMTDLTPGCYPVVPTSTSFKFAATDEEGAVETVARHQLPLQPGFAMTIHSAQGVTSRCPIIVDLQRGGFESYVAASRATRREDVYLMAPVTRAQLNGTGLPYSLRTELYRLGKIAAKTQTEHDHVDWRIGGI